MRYKKIIINAINSDNSMIIKIRLIVPKNTNQTINTRDETPRPTPTERQPFTNNRVLV
jgi:hypothetical protein